MAVRITYATMSADNEELNTGYETAVAAARARLGETHGVIVDGEERTNREMYEERSPIDDDIVIGHYAQATDQDIDDAIAAAKAFQPEWEAVGWEARRDLLLKAADVAMILDVPPHWTMIGYFCLGYANAEGVTPTLETDGWEHRGDPSASIVRR